MIVIISAISVFYQFHYLFLINFTSSLVEVESKKISFRAFTNFINNNNKVDLKNGMVIKKNRYKKILNIVFTISREGIINNQ